LTANNSTDDANSADAAGVIRGIRIIGGIGEAVGS
jgi:hypothetical protein